MTQLRKKKEIGLHALARPESIPDRDVIDNWNRWVNEFKELVLENVRPTHSYIREASIEWGEYEQEWLLRITSTDVRDRLEMLVDDSPRIEVTRSGKLPADASVQDAIEWFSATYKKIHEDEDIILKAYITKSLAS